jgi:hypothetical protein
MTDILISTGTAPGRKEPWATCPGLAGNVNDNGSVPQGRSGTTKYMTRLHEFELESDVRCDDNVLGSLPPASATPDPHWTGIRIGRPQARRRVRLLPCCGSVMVAAARMTSHPPDATRSRITGA